MNFKVIALGIIIFLIGFILTLSEPFYFPNYGYVKGIYKAHQASVQIPANTEKIVINFTITNSDNAIIAFISKGIGNVSIISGSSVIENQANGVSVILPLGNYELVVINTQNTLQTINYTYGLFNAGFISSFYSRLGLLSTTLEILMLGGAAIAFLSFIYEFLSRKKRS